MITIKLTGATNGWVKMALEQGRRESEKQGLDFKSAHILAITPERGRVFEKLAGAVTFTAHG